MGGAEEYIRGVHDWLKENQDRDPTNFCHSIAVQASLEAGDDNPQFALFYRELPSEDGQRRTEDMIPLLYEGKVVFGAHCVYVRHPTALCPLLGKPEHIETYSQQAFGKHFPYHWVPDGLVQKLLSEHTDTRILDRDMLAPIV